MEGRIHGSVRTTPRIRAELQTSKESSRKLAARYRLNVKTVAKGDQVPLRRTTLVWGLPTLAAPSSQPLGAEFRQRTMMPLDDMLGHLLDYFPQLTRSHSHRYFGASWDKPNTQKRSGSQARQIRQNGNGLSAHR